ncbi:MAG: hypothetical protein PWQ09_1198 [Candidatus Cloacimonadota bacterium]|nr:hypothetical protein [Candidatus Cloacimonadota bacterium]
MKIEFTYAGGNTINFNKKQISFAEKPDLKTDYEPYGLMIRVPSVSLSFVFDDDFASGTSSTLIDFLKANYNEIESVKLFNDNGVLLFRGNIDLDSKIDIDRESKTLKFEFLHWIDEVLDTQIVSGKVYESGFYPTIGQWMDGDDILPGAGAMREVFQQFFADHLSMMNLEFPENWIEDQPFYWIYNTKLPSFYPYLDRVGFSVRAYLGGKTVLEALKDLCTAAFCRIAIDNDMARIVSCGDNGELTDDFQQLVNTGNSVSKENIVETQIGSSIRPMYLFWRPDAGQYGDDVQIELGEDRTINWLKEFYSQYGKVSYMERSFNGIIGDLDCGTDFIYNGKKQTITEMQKDSRFVNLPYLPANFKTIEVQ